MRVERAPNAGRIAPRPPPTPLSSFQLAPCAMAPASPRTPDRRRSSKDVEEGRPLTGGGRPGSPGGAAPPASRSRALAGATAAVLLLAGAGVAYRHAHPPVRDLGVPSKPPPAGRISPDEGFVSVHGGRFSLGCRPFLVAGFNAHDLAPKAMATLEVNRCNKNKPGRAWVREQFLNATRAGLNVARVYAHTTDPKLPVLLGASEVNEDVLAGLDIVLEEARRAGLKVILSLLDNWKFRGGVDEIVELSPTAPPRARKRPGSQDGDGDFDDTVLSDEVKKYEVSRHALFFTDPGAKDIYAWWVRTVLTRRNAFNGRTYSEDPTIMAVNLLNEPRCETWAVPECGAAFRSWVAFAAGVVRSVDAKHLITVGSEGFYADPARAHLNPQPWGAQVGQDFAADAAVAGIDFATVHYWPDNWFLESEDAFMKTWIDGHVDDAAALGKPVLLQEFGKTLPKVRAGAAWAKQVAEKRDPSFAAVYAHAADHARRGTALAGALFWRLELPVYAGSTNADYGVAWGDSTLKTVSDFARTAASLVAAVAPAHSCKLGCWVGDGTPGGDCVESHAACADARSAGASPPDAAAAGVAVWPSRRACCAAGTGAHAQGCARKRPAKA